jgi:peptidyl-prolyl cis-trans isomerase SurA
MSSQWRRRALAGGLSLALALSCVSSAEASIVERIVAVVGERPILLSDLRKRARPFLQRIYSGARSPAEVAAAETQMFKELLNRMIDDRLEESSADKARINVSLDEVDSAIRNIAAQAKIDSKELIAEAKRQGLTEQDYRDELRRQVLEGKLIQLRVRGRVKVSDEDGRAMYARWLRETGAQVDVRILAMRTVPTPAVQQARTLLADDIARRARAGEDFCKLVAQYSDDSQTNGTCGSRGLLTMDNLVKEVQAAIKPLKQGETTDPIAYAPDGHNIEALLIVQLHTAPKVPTYEEMRDQMMDRAFAESMERQRKIWLADLRRGVYVDVRL